MFDYSYANIISPIACFLHFLATEDPLKARSSLESKCNASQRMESMTEDHEGIFVDSMRRNHFCVFLTKWAKRGRRARANKKIGTGREIIHRPLSFYPRNTQPNILCPTNVRPGEEWAHLELTKPQVSKRV